MTTPRSPHHGDPGFCSDLLSPGVVAVGLKRECSVATKTVPSATGQVHAEHAGRRRGVGEVACGREAASSSLTSLEALETTSHPRPAQTPSQSRLHANHHDERLRVIDVLDSEPSGRWDKRITRMDNCAAHPFVSISDQGIPVLSLARCRDRLCPLCSKIKARHTARQIAVVVAAMNSVRFITLTLREDGGSLADRLNRMAKAFVDLRRMKGWRAAVDGGVWAIETTRGCKGKGWHVHLHLLVEGRYLHQAQLSEMWNHATDGSPIVDIRLVADRERGGRYISKYIGKGGDLRGLDQVELLELAAAMHRRRTFGTFGTMHAAMKEQPDGEGKAVLASHPISVGRVLWAVKNECVDATRALAVIARCGTAWCKVFAIEPTAGDIENPVGNNAVDLGLLAHLLLRTDEWVTDKRAHERSHPPRKRPPRQPRLFDKHAPASALLRY